MEYNPYETNNNNQPQQPENNGYQQPTYQQPDYTEQPQYTQPQYTQPQNYQQQYTGQPVYFTQAVYNERDGRGMAIASLILGISSFFCCGSILSILGIIFGLISKSKKPHGNGLAVAGIIVSIVGLVVTILTLIYAFSSGLYQDLINEIMYE